LLSLDLDRDGFLDTPGLFLDTPGLAVAMSQFFASQDAAAPTTSSSAACGRQA
jgi:hypothetical protein